MCEVAVSKYSKSLTGKNMGEEGGGGGMSICHTYKVAVSKYSKSITSKNGGGEEEGDSMKSRLQSCSVKLKQCFLKETMSPNHLSLSATLKIMVLSYGDHFSNNILWAEMVIGRNG